MNDESTGLSAVSDAVWTRYGQVGFDELTEAEQVFVCVWSTVGEIDNGGFEQFYFNSSGGYATRCPDAFRAIGADDLASIIERANGTFAAGPSTDDGTRQVQLDGLSDEKMKTLKKLSSQFDATKVDELLWQYVKTNHCHAE